MDLFGFYINSALNHLRLVDTSFTKMTERFGLLKMENHWNLGDKFPLISRALLAIQADLNIGWSWFFLWSPIPPLFFSIPLKTIPGAPTTIGITIIIMFHGFFSSLSRSKSLSIFFFFTLWSAGIAKSTWWLLFFFWIKNRAGRLAEIRWSVCISKSQRILYISYSRTGIYNLVRWSNFDLSHSFH